MDWDAAHDDCAPRRGVKVNMTRQFYVLSQNDGRGSQLVAIALQMVLRVKSIKCDRDDATDGVGL